MKRVSAGFRDDVDDATERAARLGRVHVRLHAHFRDRVNRRFDRHRADRALVVVHAIDELVVQHVVHAVNGHRRGLPALVRPRAIRERAERAFIRARNELHHADDVPAWYRSILHRLRVDERADRRRVGLQQWGLAADGQVLLHRPELHLRVDARAVARRKVHACLTV